jgi:hypothetical protein
MIRKNQAPPRLLVAVPNLFLSSPAWPKPCACFEAGSFQMYTLIAAVFLYPEKSRGELLSGQRPVCFRIPSSFEVAPIGFLLGGFSSTAGYVPGNDARFACALRATSALLPVVPCRMASIVFIRPTLESSFNISVSKAFRLRFRAS